MALPSRNLGGITSAASEVLLLAMPSAGDSIQFEKAGVAEIATGFVINKADLPGARTALSELEQRLGLNQRRPKLIGTIAKRHCDPGVDELFAELVS